MTKTTKIDAIRLTGRSGEMYEFRVYVWETRFKPLPGVYVVASRSVEPNQPARYDPLFVGTADDLSTALMEHPKGDCFQMYYANVVGLLRLDDAERRAKVAADLIDALSPPCNAAEME